MVLKKTNSIITHVACYVGFDWSKLAKKTKDAKGVKFVVFVHGGPKSQLLES